jgi:hypothetical protein
MVFTKHLREGVRRGRIRCSIRIWTRLHVKVGGRYQMDEGHIVVESITPTALADGPERVPDSVSLSASRRMGHAGDESPLENVTTPNSNHMSQVSTPGAAGPKDTALARRSLHARQSEAQPR